MKTRILLLFLTFVAFFSCSKSEKTAILVMNYNVENLFDTADDPTIIDEEFTPESKKNWTEKRYAKKLIDLARVISCVGTENLPAIVGLEEIENRKVLEDLTKQAALRKANYQIAHFNSPDKRGIDVALLYNPSVFKWSNSEVLAVGLDFTTRDILHVSGTINNEDFHFYINHWPSRRGGLSESEVYRLVAAKTLKTSVDEVLAQNPQANIVIMGDMNDEPSNTSLKEVLGAKAPNEEGELFNLMYAAHRKGEGTYNFRGNWNMLDNFVVSKSLLDADGLGVKDSSGHILRLPFMEYTNREGELSPNRTYGGPNYYGGVSDHFPIFFTLSEPSKN